MGCGGRVDSHESSLAIAVLEAEDSPREANSTELRTLRFSLVDDLRTSWLAQRTGPESF